MKKMWKFIALLTAILAISVVSCKKEAAPAETTTDEPAIAAPVDATADVVETTEVEVETTEVDVVVDATADTTADAE